VVLWCPLCALSRGASRVRVCLLEYDLVQKASDVSPAYLRVASLSAALKKSLRIRPLTQGEDRLTVGLRHRPVKVAWCARLGAGLGFLYPPVLGVQVWLSGRFGSVAVARWLFVSP
jgi:hypothetical protein